jgi:signal peptidase I
MFRRLMILLVLIGALAALSRGVEIHEVRTEDMAPNLLPGDRLLIDATAFSRRDPVIGEVVLFEMAVEGSRRYPTATRPGLPRRRFVGRIVGTPADVVAYTRGVLRINQDRVREAPIPTTYTDPDGRQPRLYRQPIGARNFIIARDVGRPEPETPDTQLKDGHYFILGDFRTRAYDSRHWGALSRSDLLGPVLLILFSQDPATRELRWSRVGDGVDG